MALLEGLLLASVVTYKWPSKKSTGGQVAEAPSSLGPTNHTTRNGLHKLSNLCRAAQVRDSRMRCRHHPRLPLVPLLAASNRSSCSEARSSSASRPWPGGGGGDNGRRRPVGVLLSLPLASGD